MDKRTALAKIAKEIEHCEICQEGKSGKAVPGEGNPNASIVFVGEAPGKQEAKTGRPFVGPSGQFLRTLIKDIGLCAEDVFITSGVKYLPDRGKPSKPDIVHGRIHLLKQLAVIDPKLVVLLGSVASEVVLNTAIPIVKEHGKVIESDGRKYFVTFHPAAALRVETFRPLIKADFQKLKSLVSTITVPYDSEEAGERKCS